MPWVDLAVVSAVVWGAINGWFQGSIRLLIQVLLLCASVSVANYYRSILAAYLVRRTDVLSVLNRSISHHLVLPVDLGYRANSLSAVERFERLAVNISIPDPFRQSLLRSVVQQEIPAVVESLMNEGAVMSEVLAHLMINVFSFVISLAIISALLYIVSNILTHRCPLKLARYADRLGGAILGGVRSYLIISLVVGAGVGLCFTQAPLFLIRELDDSVLIRYSMELFLQIGDWWR